ncbi:TPA: hypothetical protein ACH3X1_007474 [Trebouxia sp. C0004]
MATSGTRSSARSGNIVNLAADSALNADALYAADHDGRNAVLALDQARNMKDSYKDLNKALLIRTKAQHPFWGFSSAVFTRRH